MSLLNDPAIKAIIKAFDDEIIRLTGILALNSCANFEDYKYKCGEIKGLKTAKDLVINTLKSKNEDDD